MDRLATPEAVYTIIILVIIASGLIARRLPLRQYAKMILSWLAIFAVAFVAFSFRPELSMAWNRVKGELTGAPRQSLDGDILKLVRQDDGHFWLRATVNGVSSDFMVDSGASTTAIGAELAKSAKVKLDGRSTELETANGIIQARIGEVSKFRVGDLQVDDHQVVIAENFGDTNVVGMNFLDSFSSWTVKGDIMELRP